MAGSVWPRTLEQAGDTVPDLDDPQDLVNLVRAVNALRAQTARSWPITTAATADLGPYWPKWLLPGHGGVALECRPAGLPKAMAFLIAAWMAGR